MAQPFTVLLLIALPLLASATLSVYNLQALGEDNDALKDIPYSIANFGFVPYGKTIVARLMMASTEFAKQCVVDPNDNANYQNSFLLIPRGECAFVTKALNAQQLGAQMAIIMDDEQHEKLVIMTDNNYGYKVKIPAIFINHQHGELLKGLFQEAIEEKVSVMMKIAFKNQKTSKVNLTFYLQANNRQAYRLVQDFRNHYPLVKQQLNFQVFFSNVPGGSFFRSEDCLYGSKYCANNLIHDNGANGALLLKQQVREEVVLSLYPDEWWAFMKYIDDHCPTISELKECSKEAMKANGIDAGQVEKAFDSSFEKDDNSYLKRSRDHLTVAGVNKFPAVALNGQKVKGSLNAQLIFDDVCNTLLNPPSACEKYISSQKSQVREVSHEWATLVFVVVLSIIIFSLIFVAYRRYMKRKISAEMQSRVDDTVSKYVEFYSERANRK